MRSRLRQFFLFTLYWSGFLGAWRFWHRNEIIILMVHGVMDGDNPTAWVPLRPQHSRKQLELSICMLSKYYHFVTLGEAVDMLSGKKPIRPYCLVLTFDDGYRNNITHALPILRKYDAPATIFLATGHVEHRIPFWFDRLDYVLQNANVDGFEVSVANETVRFDSSNRMALSHSYKYFRDVAKKKKRPDSEMLAEMECIAEKLETESGRSLAKIFENDDWSAVLTWGEILKYSDKGVCFGSHTVDHVRLGLVDEETTRDQMFRSKKMIEAQTKKTCHHFCYPDGSFNEQTVEIARTSGYVSAVTCIEGTNRLGDDLMTLRRIHLPLNGSPTQMFAVVSGLRKSIESVISLFLRVSHENS